MSGASVSGQRSHMQGRPAGPSYREVDMLLGQEAYRILGDRRSLAKKEDSQIDMGDVERPGMSVVNDTVNDPPAFDLHTRPFKV